jgi:hypothetical protein
MRRAILRVTIAALMVGTWLPGAAYGGAVLPRVGDYLDTRYVQVLLKTGSPWEASREDARLGWPQAVSVQPERGGRRVALNYGWHDGRLLVVLQRDGAMHRELAWRRAPGMALQLGRADTLCLTAPTAAQPHCYRYVGDAQRFVTRAVLAGAYVDRQGQAYRFTVDGHAHFPGYDFRYALMLEQVNDPYDFFQIGDAGRFMAFTRAGAVVTLYPVGPARGAGYGTPDFGHPLAVLTRK